MNPTVNAPVTLSSEELALLAELIASERTKLLIEIRIPTTAAIATS